ncbi:MAG: glycoside hydrolase family 38 C-terminal domain-containing protein [Saprospiraceae bacterium]|nr:glycoside hydrolase family 38 C-terminal domain-containing protein [Saprospiraceae bacterium]
MNARLLHTTLWLILTLNLAGQTNQSDYLQGYLTEVSGKHFTYHSPLPDVTASLLLRGRADFDPIVWRAEAVPVDYDDDFVTWIWLFGMDVHDDPVRFHLQVNDRAWITFESDRTSNLGIRTFRGAQGAQLQLNVTMLDKYADQMGFAILTLPASAISPGKSPVFSVSADPEDNNAWFMTFKSTVTEGVGIYQNKVVVRDASRLWHAISADFVHIGQDEPVQIRVNGREASSVLKAGFNKVELLLPQVNDSTAFVAEVVIGSRPAERYAFTLAPVREWEILLVQHTHTDIGYTRPQTEILPEHLRYIDNALDFCDQTDHYPDDAQFRWTCETSWSVREYLRSRPQTQIDRLLRRIREGRIEATGMFLNYSEIIDEPALAAQTKLLRALKNKGIDVTTAMQNDVNGIAWCLVDYYSDTDVKYLTMGIHAHRARKPFNKPTAFWWQSPAGNRMLAYRSEHYQHGNALSLTTGQQDVFRSNLSAYLTSLEARDYPYNKVSLQFSGYITDNSPPSTKVCDIIKAWNERYAWPRLRSALARDFMIFLDEQHGEDIPVHAVAWPDWWTDGVASAANETKVVRNTHAQIAATNGLFAMARLLGSRLPESIIRDVDAVYDQLLFYDEHTHGAAESISDPLAQNTINQWGMKSAYAWEAAKQTHMLQEKALAFLEPALPDNDRPTLAVFNTLNWPRSGLVEVFIQYEVIPAGTNFTITDPQGRVVPAQLDRRRQEGAYYQLWVRDVPPMGFQTLQIKVGEAPPELPRQVLLDNTYYHLEIAPERGVITRWFDKELDLALLDPRDSLTLGQVIYEQLANRHDLERLTNTNRDTIYRPLDLSRTTLSNIRVVQRTEGAIYQSVILHGDLPGCADNRGVEIEIRLFTHEKRLELHYTLFKLPVETPEAVYVAFPFGLQQGGLAYEAQGGIVRPGIDQLGGSAADWHAIQSFAAVRQEGAQIVMTSPDIPLVHFGDINIGRYYYRLQPQTNHIYSWVLNNYWVTNFKASQQGELRWRYALTSSADHSDRFATRTGWQARVPLVPRVILPAFGSANTELVSRSMIDLDLPNLLLVQSSLSMEDNGVVLQLREVAGGHARLHISRLLQQTGARTAWRVNVMEEELEQLTDVLRIDHHATVFVKLLWD